MSSNSTIVTLVILLSGLLFAQTMSTMEIVYNSCIYKYIFIDSTLGDTLSPQQVTDVSTIIDSINGIAENNIIEYGWYFSNVYDSLTTIKSKSTKILPLLPGYDLCITINCTYNSTNYSIDTCFTISNCQCEEQPLEFLIYLPK